MATSRINLYRALAERLYRGKLDVITGTATTTTSTTSLKDTTRLDYASADINAYDRCWVYAMAAADASTRGFTRVTEGGYAAAGTLALDPALTGLTATDLYVITRDHPDDLHNAINETLRSMYELCFFPLSLHIVGNDCNDMEASTVATDYTGSASATLAAETTKVYNGGQSLKVTAGAATQYAYTANIPVNENKTLYAAVMNAVDAGDSAEFRIVNVDDSNAAIENATSDEVAWMELIFSFTVPSGCERLQAWMISTANTDVSYWDDFQIWHSGRGIYQGPSWLTNYSQMIDVRAFPHGAGGPASDNDYRANEHYSVPLDWGVEREDTRGNNPLHLWVQSTGGRRPYIYALRPLSELSTDSATTTADKDRVVDFAADLILDPERGRKRLAAARAAALVRPRPTPPIGRVGVRID